MPPELYRHHLQMPIRYGDMDTLGHVNNAVYLTYFEQSRVQYFAELALWTGEPSEYGLIVAKITCEYKAPLRMADSAVEVYTRCSRLGTKSFTMLHDLRRTHDDDQAAVGEIIVVAFNYVEDRTIALPQAWRDSLMDYEPGLTS